MTEKTPRTATVSDEAVQAPHTPIELTYTNYRGETSQRRITPRSVYFGSTEWHPEPQWLLAAYDHDKQADRAFALNDFGKPVDAAICSVEVKKLDWFKKANGDIVSDSAFGWFRLHMVVANTCFRLETPDGFIEYLFPYSHWPENEAKAAAQADFERRILSQIITNPVDVVAVRRQAFEEGFENGVEQSLDALNAYDDITRNEAEQGIRKLKPDYRALSAGPVQGCGND